MYQKIIWFIILSSSVQAQTYNFKADKMIISTEADDYETAYKRAASKCFKTLTNNIYPGEEKGLDIIDICANLKKI